MTSAYTTRNRLNKQGTGDNTNLWGDVLNSGVFDLTDFSLDGWTTKALTADYSLTTANGSADESRARVLKFTGTGAFTVTLQPLEKWYVVWNALTGNLTITTGAGTTATVYPNEIAFVICDAANVKRLTLVNGGGVRLQNLADPTSAQDAATKAYADALAFTANAGVLPGQGGNAGAFLTTDGTTASWHTLVASDLSDYATTIKGLQVALAVAL